MVGGFPGGLGSGRGLGRELNRRECQGGGEEDRFHVHTVVFSVSLASHVAVTGIQPPNVVIPESPRKIFTQCVQEADLNRKIREIRGKGFEGSISFGSSQTDDGSHLSSEGM